MQFLADTWWYGLTRRLAEADFASLAAQRAAEGFTAVQLVAGIPPEVGPSHPDAASEAGPAWYPGGTPNPRYLDLARARVELLVAKGLRPIVYGGWGPQIEWIGPARMTHWWSRLIATLDDLDVVYCLCGELDLSLDQPELLWPNRVTSDFAQTGPVAVSRRAVTRARRTLGRGLVQLGLRNSPSLLARRRRRIEAWTAVLRNVSQQTRRPVLVHTVPPTLGTEAVFAPELLAAESVQTGHSYAKRDALWQLPYAHHRRTGGRPFVNLEPWYEGIRDRFHGDDQLSAYWLSMLAGASAHAYGAHGIWNVGDGQFLAHWGRQTFETARALATPRRLGEAHAQFVASGLSTGTPSVRVQDGTLLYVERRTPTQTARFYPALGRLEWETRRVR